ncbi:MAG: hypothetical protein AAF490_18705 [Chloroflexota bacterium]
MRLRKSFGLVILILVLASCNQNDAYLETFDTPGTWRVASDSNVTGFVDNGVYDFTVLADQLTFWTTAGREFSDGIYEVEATQRSGPVDNGYGMIFRVNDESDDFYSFQISGDGFVWIGRYRQGGIEEAEPIIDDWWFPSEAINQGIDQTNILRVQAEGQNLIFFVNDTEVGRVSDASFANGDIGLMVRTLGLGGVNVEFDNFSVSPLSSAQN